MAPPGLGAGCLPRMYHNARSPHPTPCRQLIGPHGPMGQSCVRTTLPHAGSCCQPTASFELVGQEPLGGRSGCASCGETHGCYVAVGQDNKCVALSCSKAYGCFGGHGVVSAGKRVCAARNSHPSHSHGSPTEIIPGVLRSPPACHEEPRCCRLIPRIHRSPWDRRASCPHGKLHTFVLMLWVWIGVCCDEALGTCMGQARHPGTGAGFDDPEGALDWESEGAPSECAAWQEVGGSSAKCATVEELPDDSRPLSNCLDLPGAATYHSTGTSMLSGELPSAGLTLQPAGKPCRKPVRLACLHEAVEGFIARRMFCGPVPSFVFKTGVAGLGYYCERGTVQPR